MNSKTDSVYQKIYVMVSQIPKGKVSTYGRIAKLVDNCTPRMVGYAMAALPVGSDIPWQRVVNSQGKISVRAHGDPDELQRQFLISEGVVFRQTGKTDLSRFVWQGPKNLL